MVSRALRNKIKRSLLTVFRVGQRWGMDVLPRHFYSGIPDMRELAHTTDWRRPLEMFGVSGVSIESQLDFARRCCTEPLRERIQSLDLAGYAAGENGEVGYGPTESDFLYCFVATMRPRRIVQIGAGFSTAVILKAAEDSRCNVELICVDPFPTDYLKRCAGAGKIRLLGEKAQTIERSVLTDLGDSGMLFVDSTHAVRTGSEVNRIILDVLPRLPTGAYVHFHDIYFPYDYQRSILMELFFSAESTLLHAFLIGNPYYTVRCALSMLHYAAPKELMQLLPNYKPQANNEGLQPPGSTGHFPTAVYLQVVGPGRAGV